MESCYVAHEIVEAVSGNSARRIKVYAMESFHNVGVIRNLKIGDHRVAEAFTFDIFAVVLADRYRFVDNVRYAHHYRLDFFLDLVFTGGKLVDFAAQFGRLYLHGFGFILFALRHKTADKLGGFVSFCSESFDLCLYCAVFRVESENLVNKLDLVVLELVSHVLSDHFGVFAYKLDINHRGLICPFIHYHL